MIGVYQGAPGAHSEMVLASDAARLGLQCELSGLATYRAVATRVASGKAEIGILPIDNSIAGTVREGYDLVTEFDLAPLREIPWRMDNRLIGLAGAPLSGLREVLAHPLVIAECGRFLASLAARVVPCEDTGIAAREVARMGDPAIAAIGSTATAAIHGLVTLAQTIADHPGNTTRFLVVTAGSARAGLVSEAGRGRKTSLTLTIGDGPGALARPLACLAAAGVNMTKLDSKPLPGATRGTLFYVDIEGDVAEPAVAQALEALKGEAAEVHLLGSYDVIPGDAEPQILPRPRAETAAPAVLAPATSASFPKAARASRPAGSRLRIGDAVFGDGEFVVMAGPCSVESREQVMATAACVKEHGALLLRGGVFKPRTNPYAFQGMGWEGLALLGEAGRATGLPTVSEVMAVEQVERMAAGVDMLQIGARNMQNYDLLRAVGKTGQPVLLKRGLSATIEELLSAAEYILAEGNPNVVLCERGIRTFETATRNTLDLSAVPVLRERTHLPVIVDPSHGVGVARWLAPLCRAAKAVGAHGLLVEVHPNPPEAKSDKDQALTFGEFADIMADLKTVPGLPGDRVRQQVAA